MGYLNYIDTPEAIWFASVPENWRATKMRELFSERNTKVSDKDFPALSVGKMGVVPQLESAVKTDNGDNRKLIRKGDFAINSRSDRKGSGGISQYDGSASLIITVLKPHHELNGRFYHYLLRSHYFSEEFYRNGHGLVSDLWTTKWNEMRNIYIPVPSREEQDQIVCYLDWQTSKINKLIHGYQKQIKLLEERKKRIINDVCSHGLRETNVVDSGIDWLGLVPKLWRLIRIRNNYDLQNGISESGDFFEKGTPFVNYGDVYKNRILPKTVMGVANSNEQQQKTYSVKKGDIFFTRTSETIDEIGFASICLEDIEKAVFSGFLIRARAKSDMLMPEYVGYYLQTQHVRDFFTKEMNLVTRASLGQTLLKSLYIPVPPIEEQEEIVTYLNLIKEQYDRAISGVEKQMLLFKEYRTRLISDVVTGQKDVRDIVIPDYEAEMDSIEEDANTDDMESEVSSDE